MGGWELGFRVFLGLGFRIWGLGLGYGGGWDLGFKVGIGMLGFGVSGLGLEV